MTTPGAGAPVDRIGAFISIPKNASKTVLRILQLGENRDLENTDSPVIYENHQRGCVLAQRFDFRAQFVFCFSRNPYERCISWFEYHRELEPYKNLSFREWVMAGMPHHWARQNLTDYDRLLLTPLLQCTFVDDCKVDFIGRIAEFERDMKRVIDRLNEACGLRAIPRRFCYVEQRAHDGGRTQPVDSYYDADSRRMVSFLLRRDFDRFGYDR